jgi:hypothetical protein
MLENQRKIFGFEKSVFSTYQREVFYSEKKFSNLKIYILAHPMTENLKAQKIVVWTRYILKPSSKDACQVLCVLDENKAIFGHF